MNKSGILLIGLVAVMLSACSSNEETIDVSKPEIGSTKFDLTNGSSSLSGFDDANYQASNSASFSSSNVQIFSLDGPLPDMRSHYSGNNGNVGFGSVGDNSVEISDIGQPDTTRYMTGQGGSADIKKNNTASPVEKKISSSLLQTVYFDHGSYILDAGDMQVIENVVRDYKGSPNVSLSVEGHSSLQAAIQNPLERKIVNLDISLERAKSVADILIKRGVPGNKIRTVGWGEEKQTGIDNDAAARRVEIHAVSD